MTKDIHLDADGVYASSKNYKEMMRLLCLTSIYLNSSDDRELYLTCEIDNFLNGIAMEEPQVYREATNDR